MVLWVLAMALSVQCEDLKPPFESFLGEFIRVIYDYVVKLKHCTLINYYVILDNLANKWANHGSTDI